MSWISFNSPSPTLHHLPKIPHAHLQLISIPTPSFRQPLLCFLSLWIWFVWIFHINEFVLYVVCELTVVYIRILVEMMKVVWFGISLKGTADRTFCWIGCGTWFYKRIFKKLFSGLFSFWYTYLDGCLSYYDDKKSSKNWCIWFFFHNISDFFLYLRVKTK